MSRDGPSTEFPEASSGRFIIYAIGQAVSASGIWMQRMSIGWIAWELTHSVGWVGAIALTELVAAICVAPLAGAITDRCNPYLLSITTQSTAVVVALTLFCATSSGSMTLWLLFVLALLDSTWQGMNLPVRMTVINLIASRGSMARAVASNAIGFNVARAVGPALAGLIIVQAGVAFVFLVTAASFAVMIAIVFYLQTSIDRPIASSSATLAVDIVDGYKYVARTPTLAAIFMLLCAFSILGRPFTELFPAIAGEMFNGGPGVLSMLMSAQGVGALIAGFWMLRTRSNAAIVKTTFAAAFGMAGALLIFSYVESLAVGLLLMGVAGLCHVTCNVGMQSLAQLSAESAFRGRTMALYGLIVRAGTAASAAAIGLAAEWVGLQPLLGGAAALCALCVAIIFFRARGGMLDGV